jgi:hypothetical protein
MLAESNAGPAVNVSGLECLNKQGVHCCYRLFGSVALGWLAQRTFLGDWAHARP